jgi:rhamnosyltransferase
MKDIAVIVVLYKPTEDQLNYWTKITPPQCENKLNFIFVDNTPETSNASHFENSIYIPLLENKGIATAQNIGIAKAREIDTEFVCFFDQDSQFEPSLISQLKQEFITIRNNGVKIAAIGPLILDKQRGELYDDNKQIGNNQVRVNAIISSGTFTSISVFDEVGVMADRLFIDYVDHEWCWRAQRYGYLIFKSSRAILQHQVGSKTIKRFGRSFLISAPIRYFYQYRNSLWLSRLDYVPQTWKIKTIRLQLVQFVIVPWYTNKPLYTIFNMLKGIFVGLKGYLHKN